MSRISSILLVAVIAVIGCNSGKKLIISDLEKDNLKGKVKSVTLFAGNNEESGSADTTGIGPFEIRISFTSYTSTGFFAEFERFRHDSTIVFSKSIIKNKTELKRFKSDSIYPSSYDHKKYCYDGTKLKSIIRLNIRRDSISTEKFYFNNRFLIDSAFFMNNGFFFCSKFILSKFVLDTPSWARSDRRYQFDRNRNLIIEKKIHYYYRQYDRTGNWIKATKYYDGPNKALPVYLRREIKYY